MTGLFPNVLHVARREYFVRVRGRAFVITTALLAVLVIGVIFIPTILAAVGVADPPTVAVVVEADDLEPAAVVVPVEQALATPDAEAEQPEVVLEDDAEAAAQAVRDGEFDALLTVTRGSDGELAYEYLGSASPTNETRLRGDPGGTGNHDRRPSDARRRSAGGAGAALPTAVIRGGADRPGRRPRRGGLRRRLHPRLRDRHPDLHGHPDLRQLGRTERGRGEVGPGHGAAHHRGHAAAAARRQGASAPARPASPSTLPSRSRPSSAISSAGRFPRPWAWAVRHRSRSRTSTRR